MKKHLKRVLALLLCLCLLGQITAAAGAAAANGSGAALSAEADGNRLQETFAKFKRFFAKLLNALSDLFINRLIAGPLVHLLPASSAVQSYESFDLEKYDGFYPGMETFLSDAAPGAVWSLGYGSHSIVPADLGEKPYAKGAYLPYMLCNEMYRDDDGNAEDLRVRTVVLDDGSGRGKAVFAVLDAIGIANADVRQIRAALAEIAAQNGIVSVNVSCTHTHTGIDLQGVWTYPVGTALHNMLPGSAPRYGVDRTFLQAVIDGTKQSVIDALADLKAGVLWESALDISDYVWDRTPPISLDPTLYKLEFLPLDENAAPTLLASFGCHPESASYDWDSVDGKTMNFDKRLSPDFVWYMEKVVNAAGYRFIFLQGDVCTVTSGRGNSNDGMDLDAHGTAVRYGYEMGYLLLGMNMDEAGRAALNAQTGDRLGVAENAGKDGYTVWYEGLETVPAEEVEPMLNIAHRQFVIQIENNVVAILGKLGLADNFVLRDRLGRYYTVSEVGYMELGKTLNVYLSPGETFGELLNGGSGIAGFAYPAIREALGENTIVFDLMNDAAGYVANDENFVMVGLQYDENSGALESDAWCIISYGKHAANTFIGNLYTLTEEKKAGRG